MFYSPRATNPPSVAFSPHCIVNEIRTIFPEASGEYSSDLFNRLFKSPTKPTRIRKKKSPPPKKTVKPKTPRCKSKSPSKPAPRKSLSPKTSKSDSPKTSKVVKSTTQSPTTHVTLMDIYFDLSASSPSP